MRSDASSGSSHGDEDAAQFHDFFARLGISLTEGYVNADLRYTLRRMPPDVSVSFFRRVTPRGGFVVNGRQRPYVEDAYGGRLGISHLIPRSFHSNRVSASYGLTWTRPLSTFNGTLNPNYPPPIIPATGLNATLAFHGNTTTRGGISTTIRHRRDAPWGRRLSFAHPGIGSQFKSIRTSWFIRRFIEMPGRSTTSSRFGMAEARAKTAGASGECFLWVASRTRR